MTDGNLDELNWQQICASASTDVRGSRSCESQKFEFSAQLLLLQLQLHRLEARFTKLARIRVSEGEGLGLVLFGGPLSPCLLQIYLVTSFTNSCPADDEGHHVWRFVCSYVVSWFFLQLSNAWFSGDQPFSRVHIAINEISFSIRATFHHTERITE